MFSLRQCALRMFVMAGVLGKSSFLSDVNLEMDSVAEHVSLSYETDPLS